MLATGCPSPRSSSGERILSHCSHKNPRKGSDWLWAGTQVLGWPVRSYACHCGVMVGMCDISPTLSTCNERRKFPHASQPPSDA